ncbi:MAG: SGNH/GDSL hydrolase family protein [Aestuariivirga sp.]
MRAWLFTVLAFVVFGLSAAEAQEIIGGQPLFGSTSSAAQPDSTGDQQNDNFHILVIGDALGGGMGAGLTRMAELENGIDVTIRFNEESGIARPELYDWSESLPKILEGKAYDAVVVLMGANDRQTIRSDFMRFPFNTPGWTDAYKAQVDRVLNVLGRAQLKTYWVSIPPMADPEYEAAMQIVLQLQKERVEAAGAVFVDIRKAFLNPDGTYTNQGPDETGAVRKLRARDGINFFRQGNNRMGQLVLEAIKQGGTDRRPVVQSGLEEVETPPGVAEPIRPLFGQRGIAGLDVLFHPEDIGAAVASLVEQGTFDQGLSALRAIAPPGSAAERLFVDGRSAIAPAGRADDFSLPKQ